MRKQTTGNHLEILSGYPLTGTVVTATDIRAGTSLLLAGLNTSGITYIEDIYHIERGFEM